MRLDVRCSESVLMFLLALGQVIQDAQSVSCFEGPCADDLTQCSECQGAGCLRATRLESRDTFRSVALTCLPEETREYGLEPDGCRRNTQTDGRVCVCYVDWCNFAPTLRPSSIILYACCIFAALSIVRPSFMHG